MTNATTITYQDKDGIQQTMDVDLTDRTHRAITPFCFHQVKKLWWVLDADWVWFDGRRIIIFRRGFGWDGASAPSLVWWYESPGEHLAASGPHDSIYTFHWVEIWDCEQRIWIVVRANKAYTDQLFFDILTYYYKVDVIKTSTMWSAVCVFGWYAWYTGNCRGKCAKCKASVGTDCPYRDHIPPISTKWELTA